MSKLNSYTVKGLNDQPAYYLPALLNFHGITVRQLDSRLIAHKPQLVYTLLRAHVDGLNIGPAKLAQLKRRSRWAIDSLHSRAMVNMVTSSKAFEQWISKMTSEARVYDKDGVVKSELAGTFSYDQDADYEYELELHREVRCPECAAHETVFWEGSVNVSSGEKFEHIIGPYYRCCECDKPVRPEVGEASQLNGFLDSSTGEEWENYVEHLDYLLQQIPAHIGSTPDRLYVGGRNLDWRNRDGYKVIGFDAKELADTMRVNGQFNIHGGELLLRQDGTAQMSCGMSHHDASSSFVITPAWWCELGSDEAVEQDDMVGNEDRCKAAEALLCGGRREFEYSAGSTFKVASKTGLLDSIGYLRHQLDLERWDTEDLCDDASAFEALSCALAWVFDDFTKKVQAGTGPLAPTARHLRALINCYLNATRDGMEEAA